LGVGCGVEPDRSRDPEQPELAGAGRHAFLLLALLDRPPGSPEQPRARPRTHFPTLRGFSITTSIAFLSVRRPRNTGWRISPFDVHSVNFTSATSFGLTQVVLAASGTFSGTGFESVISGTSFACSDLSVAWSNPAPTRPT